MRVEPHADASDFAAFAETLRGDRIRNERVVRRALRHAGWQSQGTAAEEIAAAAKGFDGTLGALDRAAEELRVQNEALFAARMELDGASAFFRDLFELAPTAYVVTTTTTRIQYANDAACSLLRCSKNALAGKLLICFVSLEERSDFRSAVVHAGSSRTVSQWPISLLPAGANEKLLLRARVKVVFGATCQRALYWNLLEETDEDLF